MMRTSQNGLRFTSIALLAALSVAISRPCTAQPTAKSKAAAERALMLGRVDEAIEILRPILAARPTDGAAHLLLCRVFYSEDHTDQAVAECEAPLSNGLSADSRAQDWMGRAYGKKADNA